MQMDRKHRELVREGVRCPISLQNVWKKKTSESFLLRKLTFLPHSMQRKRSSMPMSVVGRCYAKAKSQLFQASCSNLRGRLKAVPVSSKCEAQRSNSECKFLPRDSSFTLLDMDSQTSWVPRKMSLPHLRSTVSKLLESPYAWLLAKSPRGIKVSQNITMRNEAARRRSLPKLRLKKRIVEIQRRDMGNSTIGPWLSKGNSRPDTSKWMLTTAM